MTRLARLRAQIAAEVRRREKHRRRCIADYAEFFRAAWTEIEGDVPFEEDFQHGAMFQHAQMMVEEWFLAGLPADRIETQLAQWEEDGRPYVASYREYWDQPVPIEPDDLPGCGRGRYVQRATDLAINVAPISLKSRIFMVALLAWIWLWCPTFSGFFSSGTPSNVTRDSIACRDLVSSEWYRDTFYIEWTIRADEDRVDKWSTTAGGSRESRGAGSSVVGIHADGLFLDDPDDSAKIWSEAARRDTLLFWRALGNRLKDPRRPLRFIIQQNLHAEDLSTKMVAEGMPRLAIPVEFNPLRRGELYTAPYKWRDPRENNGDVLQPARNTPTVLAAEKKRLGTHGYEAQYNCDARPIDGGIIKRWWWNFYTTRGKILPKSGAWVSVEGEVRGTAPRPRGCDVTRPAVERPEAFDRVVMACDLIFEPDEAQSSDFADIKVWASSGPDRFLVGHWRKQAGLEESCTAIEELDDEFPGCKKLIEKAANGWAAIKQMKRRVTGVVGQRPIGNKNQRLYAISPTVEAGNSYLPLGAALVDEFVEELSGATKNDDQADTTSYAIIDLDTKSDDSDPDGGEGGGV